MPLQFQNLFASLKLESSGFCRSRVGFFWRRCSRIRFAMWS